MEHLSPAAHILRQTRSSVQLAQGFGTFCKQAEIFSGGLLKIGKSPTTGLRGLIARKPIPSLTTCVHVPIDAGVSAAMACRDQPFLSRACPNIFPIDGSELTARVNNTSFLFYHQIFLAHYIADIVLENDLERMKHVGKYIDFLPRYESEFAELLRAVIPLLDASPLDQELTQTLSRAHCISPKEHRATVLWALTMIYSRSVPVTHPHMLQCMTENTQFAPLAQRALEAAVAIPASSSSDNDAQSSLRNERLQKELMERTGGGLPVLLPMIDMVNHHADETKVNVELAVPQADNTGTALAGKMGRMMLLRSTQPIAEGQELLMQYATGRSDLVKVFYGIS